MNKSHVFGIEVSKMRHGELKKTWKLVFALRTLVFSIGNIALDVVNVLASVRSPYEHLSKEMDP